MKVNVWTNSILLTVSLVSCASNDKSQYQRTMERLERPPQVQSDKSFAEEAVEVHDTAVNEAKTTGLGDDVVSLTKDAEDSALLIIKQPFDQGWNSLAAALRKLKIKVSDLNREEGIYQVRFNPDVIHTDDAGMLQTIADTLFGSGDEQIYTLKVTAKESVTEVSATLNDSTETNNIADMREGYVSVPNDNSQQLLETLYKALRGGVEAD